MKPICSPSLEPIFYFHMCVLALLAFHILFLLLPAGVETGLVNEFY